MKADLHSTSDASGEKSVHVTAGRASLEGSLCIPEGAVGIVLFAHGSGSSRHSPRNRYVAHVLQEAGIATLLFDLLTHEEEIVDARTAHLRFDIDLLTRRLLGVTDWLADSLDTGHLQVGYFGASTGAAAALVAATARPRLVRAIVSRGGRPDLAGEALLHIQTPALLIVGEADPDVLALNRSAMSHITGEAQLAVVPGATHLFEEPGAMEEVALLARDWFHRHLVPAELI